MKLALSGRIFEESYQKNDLSLRTFAGIAARLGYRGVELRTTQVTPETPAAVLREHKRLLDDHGLTVVCLEARGYPVLDDETVLRQALDMTAALGGRLIKMGGEPGRTARCAEIAAGYGIALALNNHIGTEEKPGWTETLERTADYLRRVNHPNFGILYDPAHLFISGSDYGPTALARLKGQIRNVLFQSVVETDEPAAEIDFHGRFFRTAPAGTPGGPDWTAVLRGLKTIGYDGWITVVAARPNAGDPATAAQEHYRYLVSLTGKAS